MGADICQLEGGTGSQGLWLQGSGGPGFSACLLVCGAASVPSGGQGHVQVRLWAQPVCW